MAALASLEIALTTPRGHRGHWIGWTRSPQDWIKLNPDGSFLAGNHLAGVDGILRNNQGDCVAGFMEKVGCNSIEEAETWGLLQGLKLAWEKGIRKLIVEVDSLSLQPDERRWEYSCSPCKYDLCMQGLVEKGLSNKDQAHTQRMQSCC